MGMAARGSGNEWRAPLTPDLPKNTNEAADKLNSRIFAPRSCSNPHTVG